MLTNIFSVFFGNILLYKSFSEALFSINNFQIQSKMGAANAEIKKSVEEAQKKAQQNLKIAKKMIRDKLDNFINTLQKDIGDYAKVGNSFAIFTNQQIFYENSKDTSNIDKAVDGIVGLFSGGKVGDTIGGLLKTAFAGLSASFSAGYNERVNYLVCMDQMGGVYRIDYMYIKQVFIANGLIGEQVQKLSGTMLIISSVNKALLKDQMNVYQILVDKQFTAATLEQKMSFLRIVQSTDIKQLDSPAFAPDIQIAQKYLNKHQKLTLRQIHATLFPESPTQDENTQSLFLSSMKDPKQNTLTSFLSKKAINSYINHTAYNIKLIQTESFWDEYHFYLNNVLKKSKVITYNTFQILRIHNPAEQNGQFNKYSKQTDHKLEYLWNSNILRYYYQLLNSKCIKLKAKSITKKLAQQSLQLSGWRVKQILDQQDLNDKDQNDEGNKDFFSAYIIVLDVIYNDRFHFHPEIKLSSYICPTIALDSRNIPQGSQNTLSNAVFSELSQKFAKEHDGAQLSGLISHIVKYQYSFVKKKGGDLYNRTGIFDFTSSQINLLNDYPHQNQLSLVKMDISKEFLFKELWANNLEMNLRYQMPLDGAHIKFAKSTKFSSIQYSIEQNGTWSFDGKNFSGKAILVLQDYSGNKSYASLKIYGKYKQEG